MRRSVIEKYDRAIAGRRWLLLIEGHVLCFPEKLAEIDPDLFAVVNTRTGKYEVHDAGVVRTAFSFVLAADELDERVVRRLWDSRMDREPFAAADAWAVEEKRKQQHAIDAAAADVARELADVARHV